MSRYRSAALVAAASFLTVASACSTKRDQAAPADSGSVSAGATPAAVDSAANTAAPVAPATPAVDTARAGATVNATPARVSSGANAPRADSGRKEGKVAPKPSAPAATKPNAPTTTAATTAGMAGMSAGMAGTGMAGGHATPGTMHGAATAAPATAQQASAMTANAGGAKSGPVKVNQFMSYDPDSKKVTLDVIAAFNSHQGGFNFNGGSNGSQTITVPAGWQVAMHVKNVDAIPHSAIIITDQRPLPNAPDTPAIPRAYTAHVNDGLAPQNGEDDLSFRASKPGNYLIYCGVPGHGPSGMYIKFVVSESATVPSYQM